MSTLKADTIVASDGTSPVTLTKQSAAKAFVTYHAINTTISKSLSISSATDDATGVFTLAFSNSFSDNKYCNFGAADGGGTTQAVISNAHNASFASGSYRATSQNRVGCRNVSDNGLTDRTFSCVSYLGDLA